MPKDKNIIEPLDAGFDDMVSKIVGPAGGNALKDNVIVPENALSPAPYQYTLDLGIEVEKTIEGVEMGVLQNGIPYLTQSGLAGVSGAARATIFEVTQEWEKLNSDGIIPPKSRISFFYDYLTKSGYSEQRMFIEISKNGSPHYAYPDIVCMAFVEYFAFEAQKTNETALQNYRKFAQYGIQQFIYKALGYKPGDKWRYWQDRVSLNKSSAPDGYFTIFNEVSGMVVDLINADLPVNDKTVPDISVGKWWGEYWKANSLGGKYGDRIEYDHNYPNYYPQSASNPQHPKAYPDAAIPEFRRWFKHDYLVTKFPKYILTKSNLLGGQAKAKEIGSLYQAKAIDKK